MDILDWLEAVAQAQDMAAGGKPQVERIERTAAREIVKLRAELAECKRDMDADDLPDCRMCRFFRCDDIGPFCLEEDERICTDGDLFAGRFMPTQPVRLYEVNNAPALAAKGET